MIATPGSSVKEQIGATYAARLASRGYVALAFDPSYQGASGGESRDLEDPAARVEDIRCAVDFLTTRGFVDTGRIGLLGICAGGGYAASAAMTEHRIKALGVVAPVNIGRARRQSPLSATSTAEVLAAVGEARTVAARTGEHQRRPWIPDTLEAARDAGITDPDLLDAVDYYRTPRGQHANSTNRLLFRSMGAMMSFDAFHLAEEAVDPADLRRRRRPARADLLLCRWPDALGTGEEPRRVLRHPRRGSL